MSTRIAWAMAVSLLAQPVVADNAKHKTGSSGGGHSSSSAGARHPSSGSSTSTASRSGSSSSHVRESSGRVSSPPLTDAQRRHPRPGTGSGALGGSYRHGYYDPYPYYWGWGYSPYGYYYSPYYSPYYGYYGGWGYSGGYYGDYYDSPYYYGGGRSYRRQYRDETSAVRLIVEPDDAKVYLDGRYMGEADDFDSLFERLYVSPGRHEIMLKAGGYRTHRFKVYVPEDDTVTLHCDMEEGNGEDPVEELGAPRDDADRDDADRKAARDDADSDDERPPSQRRQLEPERDSDAEPRSRTDSEGLEVAPPSERPRTGSLRVSVRPADASVYVDGEFRGVGRQVGRLTLAAGRHRIEVVRPGFRTYERQVEVRAAGSDELDIELERP